MNKQGSFSFRWCREILKLLCMGFHQFSEYDQNEIFKGVTMSVFVRCTVANGQCSKLLDDYVVSTLRQRALFEHHNFCARWSSCLYDLFCLADSHRNRLIVTKCLDKLFICQIHPGYLNCLSIGDFIKRSLVQILD